MTSTERYNRIKNLKEFLSNNGDSETEFSRIYDMLLSEFKNEFGYNPNMKENLYLNNLRQTRDKQATNYINIKNKRIKSSCYPEYSEFLIHFKQDVDEGLMIEVKPSSKQPPE